MKKLLAFFICTVLIAALTAVPARADEYYTISDYNVKVNITESNAYDVTEVIRANFNNAPARHQPQYPVSGHVAARRGTRRQHGLARQNHRHSC